MSFFRKFMKFTNHGYHTLMNHLTNNFLTDNIQVRLIFYITKASITFSGFTNF